jgi:hypothetical protein
MQLKDLFTDETSRTTTDLVLDIIRQKPGLISELADLVFKKEEPYARRAIWVLDVYDESHPEQTKQFLERIINDLSLDDHDALKRHSLRILTRHELPEEKKIKVLDFCLAILAGNEAAAPKVYAMDILYRIAMEEPGLSHEFISAIELAMAEGTAGVKNRGKKILRKLNKLTN